MDNKEIEELAKKLIEENNKKAEEQKAKEIAEETYQKAKAESEVKELAMIVQDPQKALNVKLSEKLAKEIDSSSLVEEKVAETTQILVDKGLEQQKNKAQASVILSEDDTMTADFQKYKDEYLYHGINHKIDKAWKRKIILAINDIWFIIWALVSFFTIVPVSTFLSRISALKGFIKGVAVIVGICLLLACLGGLTYFVLKQCGVF